MKTLTPKEIVRQLDKYIVGQEAAKRAVAIALRNRYRRRMLPPELARDILPKNILMIGPTGVGKTEIARRVAQLIGAPFVKVEATRFTEVGYVGRDVESIIHELVDVSVGMVYEERLREVQSKAESLADERLVNYIYQQLISSPKRARAKGRLRAQSLPLELLDDPDLIKSDKARMRAVRKRVADLVKARALDDHIIEIEVGDYDRYNLEFGPGVSVDELRESFAEFIEQYEDYSRRRRARRVSVREARRILTREEASKLINLDEVIEEGLRRAEELGVVFIDEIDKIAGPEVEVGPDVSGEGVQRDLLPIVEGCTVLTRYGPVRTDHILFIAAGAFYDRRPSDLIPELQGRFPLRVELHPLGEEEFRRILVEPENSLVRQYQALLATEGVELEFTEDAIIELARTAARLNERYENIGARRLYTVMEAVLEEISFSAPDRRGERVLIDAEYVRNRLAGLLANEDLSRYIL
ncbi:MAG: HslU--HslV peptidase ATPase subunit [Chloroflexota bacterium]